MNIIALSKNSRNIEKLPLKRVGITSVTAMNDYYYGVSNLNHHYYITQMKKDNKMNEVVSSDSILTIASNNNKLYAFSDNEDHCFLNIYDLHLNSIKKIDISHIGYGQFKYTFHKNYFIFSTQKDDNYKRSITFLNTDDYSLKTYYLGINNPDDLILYNDKLLISDTSLVETNGKAIVVFDLTTRKLRSTYTTKESIVAMQRHGDYLYVLCYTNDQYSLYQYNLVHNFKYVHSIKLAKEDGEYYSSIFINPIIS